MQSQLAQLRAACLPFVTRTFRGARWRRAVILSVVLASMSVLLGTWLAQGRGGFEQEVRQELGIEDRAWERERTEYVMIADEEWLYESYRDERSRLIRYGVGNKGDYGQLSYLVKDAAGTLVAATMTDAPPAHAELQARARSLLDDDARGLWSEAEDGMQGFSWHDTGHVERLEHIVDNQLIPDVEYYRSPLGLRETIAFIGLFAGGLFATLLLVVAPLLTGVQIAQEVHENTLQPVSGTSLSPRQLILGLTSGPIAQTGVLGLPQLAIVLVTAVLAGAVVPALGFALLSTSAALLLCMLTQLIGLGVGRRRAPGLVGIGLMTILGGSLMVGTGIGLNVDNDLIGMVTVIPQSGVVHLLREAFVPAGKLNIVAAWGIDVRLLFAGVAFIVLAGVTHLALERRVAGRTGTSLRAIEAWVAVGTLIPVAFLALPDFGTQHATPIYLVSLAMLVIPFQFVLMGRVPVGEGPASLRNVPLRPLLLEFAGYFGVHLVLTMAAVGPEILTHVPPAGAVHLLWALGVAGLLAVRAVAVPLRLGGGIWAAACLVMAMGEFFFGVVFIAESEHGFGPGFNAFFPFFEASAVLGIAQVALMVWVPWSLVRALRKGSAGLQ